MALKGTPENPRDWSPAHPSLQGATASHESAAVLRMSHAGWPFREIGQAINIGQDQLRRELQAALDAEGDAARAGKQIVGGTATAESPAAVQQASAVMTRAKFINLRDELVGKGHISKITKLDNNNIMFTLRSGEVVTYRPLDEVMIRRP